METGWPATHRHSPALKVSQAIVSEIKQEKADKHFPETHLKCRKRNSATETYKWIYWEKKSFLFVRLDEEN